MRLGGSGRGSSKIMANITLNQIRTENKYNLKSLFEDVDDDYDDSPFQYTNNCSYFEPDQFCNHAEKFSGQSYFHLNCRGLSSNWESFRELLCDLHGDQFSFDIIGISEVFNCENDKRISIPGYHDVPITRCRHKGHRGG